MHKMKKKITDYWCWESPHIQINSPFADIEQIKSLHWLIATGFLISLNLFFPPLFKSHTACFEYDNTLTVKYSFLFSLILHHPQSLCTSIPIIYIFTSLLTLLFLISTSFFLLCFYIFFPKKCLPSFLSFY